MKTFKISLIVGVIAFLAGKFLTKPKEVTTVKYITIEVEKKESKKKTRIVERKNPDGSSETRTEIDERNSSESRTDTSKIVKQGSSVTVGVLALKDLGKFSEQTHIGTVVSVPLLGSLKATSYVDSTKRVGLGLSLEF